MAAAGEFHDSLREKGVCLIVKKRILLSVAYDGTGYAGYQAQKSGVPTIEGELNRALTELTGVPVEVIGASRTDAGVHACCNLAVLTQKAVYRPISFPTR